MTVRRTHRGSLALHAVSCAVLIVAGTGLTLADNGNDDDDDNDNDNDDLLALIGIVRDFTPDHPDFDVSPPQGYGQYMWNIATTLGQDNRPVYVGGGFKVQQQAHDASGRDISWTLYNAALGDTQAVEGAPDTGSIDSAETFKEWFRDIPGINLSTLVTVSGPRREDGEYAGMYEINVPQFYPIDDRLLGNDSDHNHFFTYEILADFEYDASAGFELYFKSDDDAWVFVDDQLAADLGGISGSAEQWIDMDRLDLVDGQTYRLRLLKADRSDASCRFHLVTNIPLRGVLPLTILAIFD